MGMKKLIAFAFAALLCLHTSLAGALLNPSSDTTYKGIDVSFYQGNIDFEKVREDGIELVYIRAGEGDDITDTFFEENYTKAGKAGLRYGFYYFVTAKTCKQAEAQAARFAALIANTAYSARPAMDFEKYGNLSNMQINTIGLTFLQKLKELTGITPMVYTDAYHARVLWDSAYRDYPGWIADYNNGYGLPDDDEWKAWSGYQYSDTGKIDGISTNVDLDLFTSAVLLEPQETSSGGNNDSCYAKRMG